MLPHGRRILAFPEDCNSSNLASVETTVIDSNVVGMPGLPSILPDARIVTIAS